MGTRKRLSSISTTLTYLLLSSLTCPTVLTESLNNGSTSTSKSTPGQGSNSTDAPLRYVRGVYQVPEAPSAIPVIYDSYFPIIFEFNLPVWDLQSMKIQFWKDHNNCTDSDKFSDGYPCPIMFHSNKWIEYFVGNMTLWKNLFLDDPLPVEAHPEVMDDNPDLDLPLLFSRNHSLILDQEYYCSKIVPHFTNFQTTRERVTQYYDLLAKCENEIVLLHKNLSSTAPFLETLYHTTFASFVTDYWDRLPSLISKQASTLNIYTSLETTLLLHQFMETQKWSLALTSCQQGQIPWTLLDHDEILNAIRSHVHLFEYQLGIPLSEMSKYFKLPLTDCVFVGRDTLVVRILVPIRTHAKDQQESQDKNPYKIIKFEPIIFHGDGGFCWIDGIRERRFISDGAHPGNLYVTECSDQEQKLCRVPGSHYSSHDAADPCAQALYLEEETAIVEACSLKCLPLEERHFSYKYFNLAHTYDDNFIYAVADDEVGIEISCGGAPSMKISRLEYAAWNLTLPCGCDITGGGGRGSSPRINFEIAPPCESQLIVERIRPYHWRNVSTRTMNAAAAASMGSAAGTGSSLGFLNIRTEDELVALLDQRYGGSGGYNHTLHYTTLWLIILVLGVGLGVLGYFVVQLQRWKSHEQFKESRLIYSNVMCSREDFPMEGQLGEGQPHTRY